jgi:transposase, IS30 family
MRRELRRMSTTETTELWPRWNAGESVRDIGRALGRDHSAVCWVVAARGGIAPAPRRRAPWTLSTTDREEISRGLAADQSFGQIATGLGRAVSTISREVARHGGRRAYRAAHADRRAWVCARRPKPCRLAQHRALCARGAEKLAIDWSPQQIAGWLRRTFPDNPEMQVSHETIYLSLFGQSRGVLKRTLLAHLRRARTMRRSQQAAPARQQRGRILDAVSIAARPATVEDRAVPGHWEGALLSGAANSHIATLVERQSRYVMLVRLAGTDTTTVVRALSRAVQALPRGLMASLTWDRGTELAAHKAFSVATDVRVYCCDPHSPWQRGSNENTNGLLRQYLPHGTDISILSQAQLNAIARRLNTRPRTTLDYDTPADRLAASVALTP